MRAMSKALLVLLLASCAPAAWPQETPTEQGFRDSLAIGPAVRLGYRNVDCQTVDFDGFVAGMKASGTHADVDRAQDGSAVTMTVRIRGRERCPSPYPPIVVMPAFDLKDLAGKRVTSASLRGKTTMISFFFSTCVPCILEVEPLNRFAAARPHMNFLAVTFDAPEEARAFVRRFGVRWRVVPDAQDFIERMRIKQYPLIALFDADGRLLGTRAGGVKDELEAAAVEPQLKRWMESVLRQQGG
jgi:cytochrome oxidase Cu insertion factor (SCO1/SenC/PrrC family)